ncbi:MAG: DUF4421 domain-containing protein [Bacteroidota bacterium]
MPAIMVCCLFCHPTSAQQQKVQPQQNKIVPPVRPFYFKDHDSSYYQSFERYITARFYFSQKYAGLELERPDNVSRFRYIPNTSLTMGVGVTYQSISLNFGYGFGFLNTDHEKGKTRYLDLQSHIYGRKWIIDLLGQFYKGYYLTPRGLAASNPESYYVRPDLRIQLLGVSAYRLLNPSRFSYRAALLENEKQKKSAGSVLIGAEIYYGIIKADSSLVPTILSENYRQKGVRRLDFIKIGPGIGYAYTFVIKNDFFLTGSLCASLSLDYTKQHGVENKAEKFELNKGFIYRIVAGYDKNNWNASISLVGTQMTVAAATASDKYLLQAGNFRLTLAKRITPGKMLSRKLHPIDKIIKDVKGKAGNSD